jgi:hypothetical protein
MKVSLDKGQTWVDVENVLVSQNIPDNYSENKDIEIEVVFHFDQSGLVQRLWLNNVNEGTVTESYLEIGERLVEV